MSAPQAPWVLTIAGHDPTGGAGLQADIETLVHFGCRAASVVTCLTRQNSHDVLAIDVLPAEKVIATLDCLLADFGTPTAVKTGLIGSAELACALGERLRRLNAPIVCDPVLAAGGGRNLADQQLTRAMRESLVSQARVCTPNIGELKRLVPEASSLDEGAESLLAEGCQHLLVTGGDANTEQVENIHFGQYKHRQRFLWPRLDGPREGRFHGTGCTLASAIVALLARGAEPEQALFEAQSFVARTLQEVFTPGKGQAFPNRLGRAE